LEYRIPYSENVLLEPLLVKRLRQVARLRSNADKHFDEHELATLILAIASINVWNRLNVAVRQPAGAWKP